MLIRSEVLYRDTSVVGHMKWNCASSENGMPSTLHFLRRMCETRASEELL